MNDPVEESLQRLLPAGPDDDLRGRVLLAVDAELQQSRTNQWDLMLAVAALVLFMIGGGSIWRANVRHDQQMARLLGPPATPKVIADLEATIASVADESTGALWAGQLLLVRSRLMKTIPASVCSLTLEEPVSRSLIEGPENETLQENPETDGARRSAPRRSTSYSPFGSPMEFRQTA